MLSESWNRGVRSEVDFPDKTSITGQRLGKQRLKAGILKSIAWATQNGSTLPLQRIVCDKINVLPRKESTSPRQQILPTVNCFLSNQLVALEDKPWENVCYFRSRLYLLGEVDLDSYKLVSYKTGEWMVIQWPASLRKTGDIKRLPRDKTSGGQNWL
jgi:hypothetical protein